MSYLYEYMSPDELSVAREDSIFENAHIKFNHRFDCLVMEHNIRMNDIDTECILREYTKDDLENMYVAEMSVYMEGVKEWWQKFKEWVKSIINSIFNKTKPEEFKDASQSDEIVEVDYDPNVVVRVLNKLRGVIKNITDVKNEDGSGLDPVKLGKRLGIAAAAGGSIAAVFALAKKKISLPKNKIVEYIESIKKNIKGVEQETNNQQEPTGSSDSSEKIGVLKMVQELVSNALKLAKDSINNLSSKISKNDKLDEPDTEKDKANKSKVPPTRFESVWNENDSSISDLLSESTRSNEDFKNLLDLIIDL